MNQTNQFLSLTPAAQTDHPALSLSNEKSGLRHNRFPWPANSRRCPECGAIVYCRRHQLCGVCGERLPNAFLFSKADAMLIEQVLAAERARHRRWMARVRESG
jgi:hypothetical protein